MDRAQKAAKKAEIENRLKKKFNKSIKKAKTADELIDEANNKLKAARNGKLRDVGLVRMVARRPAELQK